MPVCIFMIFVSDSETFLMRKGCEMLNKLNVSAVQSLDPVESSKLCGIHVFVRRG